MSGQNTDITTTERPHAAPLATPPAWALNLPFQTPFLALHIPTIANACAHFKRALPTVDIHYAVKCNPHPRILETIHNLHESFEIASYPELEELMRLGVAAEDVIFSNPVKPIEHIDSAYRAGVYRFAFDSEYELLKIARVAPKAGVYVRIKTKPASSVVPSEGKFGVESTTALRLMKKARDFGLHPMGIAFHVGSQKVDTADWGEALRDAGSLMRDLANEGIMLDMLDMGGGFPAQYASEVPPLEMYAHEILEGISRHLPYVPKKLVIEPGRGLVGNAGIMVTTVIGIASRGDRPWVHVDVGAFNGMMESLETLNSLIFPLSDSRAHPLKVLYNVTGPSCDSQDTILFGAPLSHNLTVGDRVFIHTTGAYTTSYASNFNGFDIPHVHCVEE